MNRIHGILLRYNNAEVLFLLYCVITASLNIVLWINSPVMNYQLYTFTFIFSLCVLILRYTVLNKGEMIEGVEYIVTIILYSLFLGIFFVPLNSILTLAYSNYGRKIRYRGYLFNTKNNRMRHTSRILSGELERELPESFE